jgi:hypothetical protein
MFSQNQNVTLKTINKQIATLDEKINRLKEILEVEEKDTSELEQKKVMVEDVEWLKKRKNELLAMNFITEEYKKHSVEEYADMCVELGTICLLDRKNKGLQWLEDLLTKLKDDASDADSIISLLGFMEQMIVALFRQEEREL